MLLLYAHGKRSGRATRRGAGVQFVAPSGGAALGRAAAGGRLRAGRVGASIAAELGTMKVTEQIDALKALATNPVQYLVIPRFVAGITMLFVLTIYADWIGMFGGYLISVFKLGMSSPQYIKRSFHAMLVKDVITGLIKAFFFGGIISIVGCYFGFRARGGAEGVGRSTTLAVVVSLIMVIAFDALFTAIFYFV